MIQQGTGAKLLVPTNGNRSLDLIFSLSYF